MENNTLDFMEVRNPRTLPARLAAQRISLGLTYKPVIAKLPSGELLVVSFLMKKVERDEYREDELLYHSNDGGKTWLEPRTDVDQFREDVMLYRSGDGGKTWSGPEILDLPGCEPYLTVLKDGTIFITSNEMENSVRNKKNYCYNYLHRSQDGGRTWSSTLIMPEEFRPVANITTRNVLEMDDGSLMIGFSEHRIKHPKSCVWVSTDKGKTWTEKYPAHFEDVPKDYPYTIMGEAYLWQGRSGKIYTIVRVGVLNSWPIDGTTDPGTIHEGRHDNSERMILYFTKDMGHNWQKVRDLGNYGQMYPSIMRLDDDRLLLTFTQRAISPPLGVRAVFGRETQDDITFDMENDHIMIDTKTGNKKSGGGFGPTVQLDDGTLVTSYSYRGEDGENYTEVVRWRLT